MTYGTYILEAWCDAEKATKCWKVVRIKAISRTVAIGKLKLAGWRIKNLGDSRTGRTFCPECMKLITFAANGRVYYDSEPIAREPKNLRNPYWLATHNGALYGYKS